jgi:putative transposase
MDRDNDRDTSYLVTLWTYGARPIFSEAAYAALFCRTLASLRQRLAFRLRAYVILPDRVRLIVSAGADDPRGIQVLVHRLKSRFARELNHRRGRLGLVWQDAEQRVPLQDEEDVVRRADFMHRSPVMARLASHPGEWRLSSYRAWAGAGRAPVPVDLPAVRAPRAAGARGPAVTG